MRRGAVRAAMGKQNTTTDALMFQGQSLVDMSVRRLQPTANGNYHSEVRSLSVISSFPSAAPALVSLAKAVLHSRLYTLCLWTLTMFSFLLDDIRELTLAKEADCLIDSLILTTVACFVADIVIKTLGKKEYAGSFVFWMHFCATIGLAGDVHLLFPDLKAECTNYRLHRLSIILRAARLSDSAISLIHSLAVNSAQRVSRSFSGNVSPQLPEKGKRRKSKSIAVAFNSRPSDTQSQYRPMFTENLPKEADWSFESEVQLKRLSTLQKLYTKNCSRFVTSRTTTIPESVLTETRLSRALTEKSVSLLVCLVIGISVSEWLSGLGDEVSVRDNQQYGLKLLWAAHELGSAKNVVAELARNQSREGSLELLVRVVRGAEILWENGLDSVREDNICSVSYKEFTAYYDISKKVRIYSVFDLATTFLFCVLLVMTCIELSSILRYVVLYPLQRVVHTIHSMAKNPLAFVYSSKAIIERSKRPTCCCYTRAESADAEIYLLECAFRKIGVMLVLVFGNAGSEVISKALDLEGNHRAIAHGKRVLAIFCFAKIGSFDALVNCLGTEALKYVNIVSALVHSTCEKYMGAVNRNLGESYLLVWKFPSRELITVRDRVTLNPFSTEVSSTASLALLFAVKVSAKKATSLRLFLYQDRKELLQRAIETRNRLSFGFHVGWAFEGAIGSEFKIDASYLSPHVNLAARVESVGKQYGASILLSQEMFTRLEEDVKSFLRHIDTVRLKGVAQDVCLYSFDLSLAGLSLNGKEPTKTQTERKRKKLKAALEQRIVTVSQMFTHSVAIAALRRQYTKAFLEKYEEAREKFAGGNWQEAADVIRSHCLPLVPLDGPCRTLLAFMEETDWKAPRNWTGVRELESK